MLHQTMCSYTIQPINANRSILKKIKAKRRCIEKQSVSVHIFTSPSNRHTTFCTIENCCYEISNGHPNERRKNKQKQKNIFYFHYFFSRVFKKKNEEVKFAMFLFHYKLLFDLMPSQLKLFSREKKNLMIEIEHYKNYKI